MDEAAVTARIERLADASSEPTLDAADIAQALTVGVRADANGVPATNVATAPTWAAGTAYTLGNVVKANGRWWRCALAGTSEATEPNWPDLSGFPTGTVVTDGDDLEWVDAGGPYSPTWDVNACVAEAWRIKAAKAAQMFDFATDGQRFQASQVLAHCQLMERAYRRRVFSVGRVG